MSQHVGGGHMATCGTGYQAQLQASLLTKLEFQLLFQYCLGLVFWRQGPGCPDSHCIAQAGLELKAILLLFPFGCQEYTCDLTYPSQIFCGWDCSSVVESVTTHEVLDYTAKINLVC